MSKSWIAPREGGYIPKHRGLINPKPPEGPAGIVRAIFEKKHVPQHKRTWHNEWFFVPELDGFGGFPVNERPCNCDLQRHHEEGEQ